MNNYNVLLIENDLSLALLLEMWLSERVDKVIVAQNYEEAAEELNQQDFNFLFVDISQSREKQFDDFSEFHQKQSLKHPIIVVTSCNDSEDLKRLSQIDNVVSVIEKPITPEHLENAQELIYG